MVIRKLCVRKKTCCWGPIQQPSQHSTISHEQTVLNSVESKHCQIQATLCEGQEQNQMLTLEDGRLQASNAVSTRFLSAENKRYMLQNEDKTEGVDFKSCLGCPCGLQAEYCLWDYHIFHYLFSFAGFSVTQVSLMVPRTSVTLSRGLSWTWCCYSYHAAATSSSKNRSAN